MFSEKEISIAREIAQSINLPVHFGPDESDGYYEPSTIYRQLISFEEKYGEIDMRNGISKLTIIFSKLPFVIKIPFNGLWYYDEVYNEETEEYEEGENNFCYFTCARSTYNDDYCEMEMDTLNDMIHFGYGALAAEEICIGEINYHNFYIQEKVRTGSSPKSKPSEDSLKRAENMDNYYRICSNEWRAVVIELYGEDYWTRFVDWAASNCGWVLDDMHGGNYGYRMDGTPVMFDVSGFDN